MADNKEGAVVDMDGLELYNVAGSIMQKMPDGKEKEVLLELRSRYIDYQQIQVSSLKELEESNLSTHKSHVETLKRKVEFFSVMWHTLSTYDLVDWKKSIKEAPHFLMEKVRELRAYPPRLVAVICEIYARGGVKFNYQALPEEVREPVKKILKETKQIYD